MNSAPTSRSQNRLDARSKEIRRRILRTLEASGRGHLGAAFSLVEIVRVLYDDVLKYDARQPRSPDRDRFVLSKGHGCLALYAVLAEKGFFPEAELERFCQSEGLLGGHPEFPRVPGVEFSTGSLGHGFPVAVGMAVAAKRRNAPHRVFAVIGDGESSEGSIWEAALIAANHKLDNLVVITDYNKEATYGPLSTLFPLEPIVDKWRAFGFEVAEVDGHDVGALRKTLGNVPLRPGRPSAIVCHTVKGMGVDPGLSWHHKTNISKEQIQALMASLEAA